VSLKITQFPILVPSKNSGKKSGVSYLKSTFAVSVFVSPGFILSVGIVSSSIVTWVCVSI